VETETLNSKIFRNFFPYTTTNFRTIFLVHFRAKVVVLVIAIKNGRSSSKKPIRLAVQDKRERNSEDQRHLALNPCDSIVKL
jgi:hypothetical protein